MKLNIKTAVILLSLIICLIVSIRLIIIAREGEEGRLKRTIYKAKRLAERENILGLTNYISVNYEDGLGNDRRSFLAIAKTFFDSYNSILISINSLEIDIEGASGTVQIDATVYWRENSAENIYYDTAKARAVFKKENRGWKLIQLEFLEPEKKNLFNPMVG